VVDSHSWPSSSWMALRSIPRAYSDEAQKCRSPCGPSRLDDLDVLCSVLSCEPSDLLIREPEQVAARRPPKPAKTAPAGLAARITPRLGRNRSAPPA
jgi:hypothetical protein